MTCLKGFPSTQHKTGVHADNNTALSKHCKISLWLISGWCLLCRLNCVSISSFCCSLLYPLLSPINCADGKVLGSGTLFVIDVYRECQIGAPISSWNWSNTNNILWNKLTSNKNNGYFLPKLEEIQTICSCLSVQKCTQRDTHIDKYNSLDEGNILSSTDSIFN